MVLPLLAWGGVALVTAIAGYFTYDNWYDIVTYFSGKKIVILGQRATGKTTLMHFLMHGEMVENPSATIGVETVSGKSLDALKFKVKISDTQKDYPGCNGSYEIWKTAATEADILVYLFRIDEWMLDTEKTEAAIQGHINNIMQSTMKKNVPLFLIGTHLDLLDKIEFTNSEEKNQFIAEIINEPFFKGIQHSFINDDRVAHISLGSLKDREGLSEMVNFILSHAKES